MSLSRHLELEIAHTFDRGPLKPGQPVPGCSCTSCTGVTLPKPPPRPVSESWTDAVDRARAIPILEVVRRLGVEPEKRGREWIVSAPYREDRSPSLRISPAKGMWFDDPMGEGGDGIKLYMLTRRLSFVEAVRELAA